MTTLTFPGVSVTIDNQTFGAQGFEGTTPLFVFATKAGKLAADGITEAVQTDVSGEVVTYTSQKDVLDLLGVPYFREVSGTVQQGDECNEYGVHALYSYLGIASKAYGVRADIDLGQLLPEPSAPTANPANGTYWFDTTNTLYGIFSANGNVNNGLAWDNEVPSVPTSDDIIIGAVQNVTVNTPSTYTSLPTITFTGGAGSGAAASATLKVTAVAVAVGGSGYTNGSYAVAFVGGTYSTQATGTVIVAGGAVTTVTISEPGIYTAVPANPVSMTGLTGGANATVNLTFGIGAVNVTAQGSGYTSAPTVVFSAGSGAATATVGQYPSNNYGLNGDYAVDTTSTNNTYFEKIVGSWRILGSTWWKKATPTVKTGTVANPTVTGSNTLTINGTTTGTFGGTSIVNVVAAINTAAITNILAYADATLHLVIVNTAGGDLTIANGTGTPMADIGLGTSGTTQTGVFLTYAPHTSVPTGTTTGSAWIKTTTPNYGADYYVYKFSTTTNTWIAQTTALYANDLLADYTIGTSRAIGSIYVYYNTTGTSSVPLATQVIRRLTSPDSFTVLGTNASPALTAGNTIVITQYYSGTLTTYTVTLTGTTLGSLLNDFALANIPNFQFTNSSNALLITKTDGRAFTIDNGSGTPLTTLGITAGTFSNWTTLTYEASAAAPTTTPDEGTLWFSGDSSFDVDIMYNNGSIWQGYLNAFATSDPAGVQLTSEEPTTQSDGSALVNNDLWINTDDTDNYPALYRWNSSVLAWEAVDKTDQTTPLGIVFADARNTSDGTADGSVTAAAMLASNYVDPDCPNPQTYPSGILIFNTRFSNYNVKVWRPRWFNAPMTGYSYVTYNDTNYATTAYEVGGYSHAALTDVARWVTASGNKADGAAYMGRHAQRIMVVEALGAVLVGNQDIRSDEVYFNLMATPGYVEVLDEMITLNTDRRETSFIVADTPARLAPSATTTAAWADNSNNAVSNGEDGLLSSSAYVGLYYPWALGTNVDGVEIMIPPSTVAMRVYAYNDLVAYPWYPPAGTERGKVTNASSVGYLLDGEYTPIKFSKGQLETLYEHKINPIMYQNSAGVSGLYVFGDKTLDPDNSAMSRVNVSRMVVHARREIEKLSVPFIFQLNIQETRDAFKAALEGFLATLIALNAITDFLVVCDDSVNTSERIARNELWAQVFLKPTRSINFIYVPVILLNPGDSFPTANN